MNGERLYIALARDEARNDSIVFSVLAPNPAKVRDLVEDFYYGQDWHPLPSRIDVRLAKHTDNRPVIFIGHALEEYQTLEDQVRKLADKLLDQTDDPLDDLYAFVEQFEIGRQAIAYRYPERYKQ